MAKILIVDDRAFNRQFLLTILSNMQHSIIEAADGAAALKVARAESPDLIITDILMPGMDGFQFIKQLRTEPAIAATRVIFYTATFRTSEARALARECGVETVLTKPSEPEAIAAAVNAELGEAGIKPAGVSVWEKRQPEEPALRGIGEKFEAYTAEVRSAKAALDQISAEASGGAGTTQLAARFSDGLTGVSRLAARLMSILELTLDANPEHGPVPLLELFLKSGLTLMQARYGAIAVCGEDGLQIQHIATQGFDADVYRNAGDALTGTPRSLADAAACVRLESEASLEGFPPGHPRISTLLGQALAFRSHRRGWIYFAEKETGEPFDDEDERILATFAAEFSVAYDNTAMHDLLQRHAAQLQIEIVRREKAEEESRRHEQQLNQLGKMEAIGQLTGGIAHDFNNLLTVISSNTEDVHEELKATPALQRQTDLILKAADRGAALVRQLLAFARKQELRPESVNLDELLARLLHLLRRTLPENIALTLNKGAGVPTVNVDAGSLENALLNLALNARDAMPEGGSLTIETGVTTLGGEQGGPIGTKPGLDVKPGRYVAVSLTDSGVGMPAETANRAFEPFFTTKAVGKGTGLGLSMVYGFVKQSGGDAGIRSEVGRGTTVSLYLPLFSGAPLPARELPAGQTALAAAGGRILLVEDDDLVRESVGLKLLRLGYEVTEVPSAAAAVAALESTPRYDLVLTDVIMPGPMNGADLAREVIRRWPDTKVLVTSGYTETTMLGKITLPDNVRLLSKPYSNAELAQTIIETRAAQPCSVGKAAPG